MEKNDMLELFREILRESKLSQLSRLPVLVGLSVDIEEIVEAIEEVKNIKERDKLNYVDFAWYSRSGFRIKSNKEEEPDFVITPIRVEGTTILNTEYSSFANIRESKKIKKYYQNQLLVTPERTKRCVYRCWVEKYFVNFDKYLIGFGSIIKEITKSEYEELKELYLHHIKFLDNQIVMKKLKEYEK